MGVKELIAELREDSDGFPESMSARAADALEATLGQLDEFELIFDAQAQALPKIVAELNEARALVGVAHEQWAVRMNLAGVDRPYYERQRDGAACQRFIDHPPLWHGRDSSSDLVVVSRTVSETEWKAAS